MISVSRIVFILLAAICVVSMSAPKHMMFGFGKRSMNLYEDDFVRDLPNKRYKPKNFAMGFGKRAGPRSFNMGFGKRSSSDYFDQPSF